MPAPLIGGLTPLTTIDYPGRLAAVVFLHGCPWRCGYCQNGHLLGDAPRDPLTWESVLGFLRRRRGLLDGVVFSGGEPTMHRELPELVREVKNLGFLAGLHTGGPYPKRLATVLPRLDWVGMDIKAPFHRYAAVTGVPKSGDQARRSAENLIASGVDHEFRTTVHPELLSRDDLTTLAADMAALGARRYVIQACRTRTCLDPSLNRPLDDDRRLGVLAQTLHVLQPSLEVSTRLI